MIVLAKAFSLLLTMLSKAKAIHLPLASSNVQLSITAGWASIQDSPRIRWDFALYTLRITFPPSLSVINFASASVLSDC